MASGNVVFCYAGLYYEYVFRFAVDAESSKINEGHGNLANALIIRPASAVSKFSSLRRGHSLECNLASSEANMNY
jgi:hypothetical protein